MTKEIDSRLGMCSNEGVTVGRQEQMEVQCTIPFSCRAVILVTTVGKTRLPEVVKVHLMNTKVDGSTMQLNSPRDLQNHRATGLLQSVLPRVWTFKLVHSSRVFDLGLDSLVRLAGQKLSLVDSLVVTLELVLPSKADLVVFAAQNWAIEFLGFDAVL